MARRTDGWRLRRDPRTKKYYVRFRHQGRRYHFSTGETDPAEASLEAARLHAEILAGKPQVFHAGSTSLELLFAKHIADRSSELADETVESHLAYAARLAEFFGDRLSRVSTASIEDYSRMRLNSVRRSTVLKELSFLRMFVAWASRPGRDLMRPVEVLNPPKRATGTAHKQGNQRRIILSPEQLEQFLRELPERTARGNPARAFFTVMAETALRYATLTKIRAPEDYVRGAEALLIRDEADKARFGRELPLSRRARAALDSVTPAGHDGLIFGRVDYRTLRRTTAMKFLPPEDAEHLSYHDIRHHTLTELAANSTDLPALSYLAGHKAAATTSKYVRGRIKGAREVLEAKADEQANPASSTLDELQCPGCAEPLTGTSRAWHCSNCHLSTDWRM